jgi:hypothetical protein
MLEAFIDAPQRYRQLTVFPILAGGGPTLPVLNTNEALESGALLVQEKGQGQGPLLLVRNMSLYGVLIREGECLVSEEHERKAVRSILLAGKSITQIPATPALETLSACAAEDREADEWLEAFPSLERQVGMLAFRGKEVLGLEATGAPALYTPIHEQLVRKFVGRALAAAWVPEHEEEAEETDAAKLLESLEAVDRLKAEGVGLGEYWVLGSPLEGGELIHEGHLVHLWVTRAPGTQAAEALSVDQDLATRRMEETA